MRELSGLPPDPDCLHCVIAPHVAAFMEARPGKKHADIVGELLQVAAELLASDIHIHELSVGAMTAGAQSLLARLIREACEGLRGEPRHPTGSSKP